MRVGKYWLLQPILDLIVVYPTPSSLSYFWNFGILAGVCLVVQLVTGIGLAMHYTPHADLAFMSVEFLMRDLDHGWLLRYLHSNGASMFFIVVYLHIFRGLLFNSFSYPRHFVWLIGMVIFVLLMATAFMGYVLPWGQMSFWGATVITSLFSVIPFAGKDIVQWLWGGFAVGNATLTRFFSLHFFLPFVIAGASLLHIVALHKSGSSNPVTGDYTTDKIPFYPYYVIKDVIGFIIFVAMFSCFVFLDPNYLNHPDNFVPANPMVTPPSIVPEWYFLPFYAILRSIPYKTEGILAMASSMAVYFLYPSASYSMSSVDQFGAFSLISLAGANGLLLGWLGACPIESPFVEVSQLATALYFILALMIVPGVGLLNRCKVK